MRIFFAIPLHFDYAMKLSKIAEENPLENIRWLKPHNLHITVLFLGEVEDNFVEEIKNIADDIISNTSSFIMQPETISLMPANKAKMVWVRYYKSEAFKMIYKKLLSALGSYFSTEGAYEDPIPHITLARLKKPINQISCKISPEEVAVNRIELWKSETRPEGAEYASIANFNLLPKIE
jgi:RNA 2',3'-cyclic 3'-phosphodiesterase